jgi:hypothetical protein
MEKQKLPNSTAVIVLGILSVLTCCCVGGAIGIILGIVASYSPKRISYTTRIQGYDGYSNLNLGRTLAIVGLVLSSIYLLVTIYLYATIGQEGINDMVKNLMEKAKYSRNSTNKKILHNRRIFLFKLFQCFDDDRHTIEQLLLVHYQWRRKADDVAVCGFGEQSVIAQSHADVPAVSLSSVSLMTTALSKPLPRTKVAILELVM